MMALHIATYRSHMRSLVRERETDFHFLSDLFSEFCNVFFTGEVKRPRLPLVVIETDIVTTLYLEVRHTHPLRL